MQDWMRERERLIKHAIGNYQRALKLMRRRDPMLSEDGFALLEPLAGEHIEELMAEYRRDDIDDHYWVLELIAGSGSYRAFDLLVEALDHEREEFRSRAADGLRNIGSKEARQLLFERGLPTR